MSVRKIILFFLVSLLFFISKDVFAYEIETHAYLTDEIVDFSGNPSASEFRSYVIDGSRREDDGARSLNHFYDPVNNVGLHDTVLGLWEKSKDWANDSANQNGVKYKVPAVIASILSAIESGKISDISAETDFTWHRAIEFYANGEKEKAFFLLGHILHLIEDTSVPDHTRNDLHPGNSPYENWTAQFNLQNKDQGLKSRLSSKSPILLDNLSSHFDGLATYSNNNFYSEDTIGLGYYKSPEPDYTGNIGKNCYAFRNNSEYGDYPILVYERCSNSLIFSNENNVSLKIAGEDKVLSNYWSRLSTKVVQHGAGVINLFFKEAEAAKNDPNFKKQGEQKSFIASIVNGAQNVMSVIAGAVQKAASALESILKQNNIQTEGLQTDASPENLASKTADALPDEEAISENTNTERIDSELAASEQVKEDVEEFQDNPETTLTESEKAAVTQMLARLDDLMRQALTFKEKMEASPVSQTPESKIVSSNSQNGSVYNFGGVGGGGGSGGGGGGVAQSSRTFPKILISEIQLSSASSTRDEFIEFYNPNDSAVDLTEWYIQKKTASSVSFSTFAPAALFASMTIPARGYFLVAHPSSTFAAGVFTSYGIADNNSLVLKNPDQGIVDKVGWGSANDCEGACAPNPADGQSIQREFAAGVFSDTDQNAVDFELQSCPSPKASANTCGVVSTASSTEPVASSTEPAATSTTSGVNHLVISEAQVAGVDAGDEFIELWNYSTSTTDLSGWSLQYVGGASVISSSTVTKKNFMATSSIAGNGFFLVARGMNSSSTDGYRGATVPNMTQRSFSLSGAAAGGKIFLVGNQELIESGADPDIVDTLDYAFAVPADGQGLERRAWRDGACVSALPNAAGEFFGNGCNATSTGAFEIRSSPNPQNSSSLPEPRTPPTITTSSIVFASSSMGLVFNWSEATDASGATSSVIYEIREIISSTATSSLVTRATSTNNFSKGVDNEVGRNFNFTLQAVDKDGLGSATSSLAVYVPSFFERFYFYQDPRASSTNKVIDAYYSNYPFVPGRRDAWKLVLFYLDSDAALDGVLRSDSPQGRFMPSGTSTLILLDYPRCSGYTGSDKYLLLPDPNGGCSVFGGGFNPVAMAGLEDLHFIVPLADSNSLSISTSSYVTAAFYDFAENWPSYTSFKLVATDKQKYYFGESAPSSTAPNPPADMSIQLDDLHSSLSLSWPAATDSDTLDSALKYEFNYSTSTEFTTSTWHSAGKNLAAGFQAIPGNGYKIGARAVDDFGNVSSPVERNWNFPSGFVPLPYQSDASQNIGRSDGNGQRIFIPSISAINKIAMVMAEGPDQYISTTFTDTYIEIHADSNNSKGELIATSSDISYNWGSSDRPMPREFVFNFLQPVNLSADTYYWIVPVNGPGISGQNFIYGASTDAYPAGYWSGNPAADAYFYIR